MPYPLNGLPRCRSFSEPAAHAPANTQRVGDGSPALRKAGLFRGEGRTSRVTGPSSSCVPWRTRSLRLLPHFGYDPSLPLLLIREDLRRDHHRLQGKQNPRHPESHSFRGHVPTAHTLARLRFAGLVAETVARLATGSGGLTPGRAGFAPAGRQSKFHGVIASSNPNRPAVPARTVLPMLVGRPERSSERERGLEPRHDLCAPERSHCRRAAVRYRLPRSGDGDGGELYLAGDQSEAGGKPRGRVPL